MKKRISIPPRMLCALALLCAAQIVLSRFAAINIGAWLKISFSFLPIALAGYMYGPRAGCLVGALSDVIGALLFPSGVFFPGFTIVSALSGAIYGFVLRGHEPGIARALLAAFDNAVICNILLNTVCLCLIGILPAPGSEGFLASMTARVIKNLVQMPVNAALLYAVLKAAARFPSVFVPRGKTDRT